MVKPIKIKKRSIIETHLIKIQTNEPSYQIFNLTFAGPISLYLL